MGIIFGISVLIISVIVHEVSHGYVADAIGDPTARLAGRLTLNPIPHIDLVGSIVVPALTFFAGGFIFGWAKPVPINPYNFKRGGKWGEALVAAAGPLSNILLAVVFGLLIRFGSVFGPAATEIFTLVVFINLILAIFNLVPIPPLDGSKILFAILPYKYNNIRMQLERYGLIVVLLFVFVLWRFIFPIIVFLFEILTGIGL